MRALSVARELVCIVGLLCAAVILSPFWLALVAWQRHEWEKQTRGVA